MKKLILLSILISISSINCMKNEEIGFIERFSSSIEFDSVTPTPPSLLCADFPGATVYNDVGNGTPTSPYIICNETQLFDFAINGCGDTGTLGCDKDYSLGSNITVTSTWIPIGKMTAGGSYNSGEVFEGTFDGNNFYIEDLLLNSAPDSFIGFMHAIDSAGTVRNLELRNASFTGTGYIGAVTSFNNGTIDNVKVSGSINGSEEVLGGLVGFNPGTITNSSFTGTVTNTGVSAGTSVYTGGLIGFANSSANIDHSFADATVTTSLTNAIDIGGFIGYSNAGSISNSYSSGTVQALGGTTSKAAGFAGTMLGNNAGAKIENCYSDSSVSASGTAVGFISVTHQGLNINDNHFSGTLSAPTVYGYFDFSPSMSNHFTNYWNSTLSGTTTYGPGADPTGKFESLTSAQMLIQANFVSWDFTTIWAMGASYPELQNVGPSF